MHPRLLAREREGRVVENADPVLRLGEFWRGGRQLGGLGSTRPAQVGRTQMRKRREDINKCGRMLELRLRLRAGRNVSESAGVACGETQVVSCCQA